MTGLNKQQVEWAKQHDWFGSAFKLDNGLYTVIAFETVVDKDGLYSEEHFSTTNFDELKAWAGY